MANPPPFTMPDDTAIRAFCERWMIRRLAIFGSAVRGDLRPESDVDVFVVFEDKAPWSYWDWPAMTGQLEAMFGRKVDLVEAVAIRNPLRRRTIFAPGAHKVLYAA
ncbi:MAG TPA: nucleotidyltransferase domain-containing protein [Phycisphaerales bacterium]|nr:nucleotidyltransferase domain-containing protein [Phycisphaerales bacterium]